MSHSLPSARHLCDFQGFFKVGNFTKDGNGVVSFTLPPEEKQAIVDLSNNDGMVLNISVWETTLPPGGDIEIAARALGLSD